MENLKDLKILITGGTGSFGRAFAKFLLTKTEVKKVYIYSRDEYKQMKMKQIFEKYSDRIQFLIGSIEDKDRVYRALNGIDYVVHAAAQKHVPSCEYNPYEAVRTNIIGGQNIIDAAIDRKIKKVIAISTDKAVNPVNLYGCTKASMEKLFISGNAYAGGQSTILSCVRYGNVMSSRGSVIPIWRKLAQKKARFPLTDERMTRFWMTLSQAVDFVYHSLDLMQGGEIFIPKLPSMKMTSLAEAICQNVEFKNIGIRQGEKLHETLISADESGDVMEMPYYYVIFPNYEWLENKRLVKEHNGKMLERGFSLSSDTNDRWLEVNEMREILNGIGD